MKRSVMTSTTTTAGLALLVSALWTPAPLTAVEWRSVEGVARGFPALCDDAGKKSPMATLQRYRQAVKKQ
jgi:hypothetical protein